VGKKLSSARGKKGIELSVVVPLFNEEESVSILFDRIVAALAPTGIEFEVLFVDDGSSDRTLEIASDIAAISPRLRVIEFRANYGQTPAMAAGIDLSQGQAIATMDGDLQNDPSDIPEMLAQLDEDTDLVVGWRRNRQDKLITRKLPSWIANRLIGRVTGVPIRDNGCSLKVYKAAVIKKIPLYSEMHRFIPAMAAIAGARVKEVPVKHHAREYGHSKYGLSRVYKVLLDLLSIKTITAFAQRPLIWFALLSVPFLFLSLILIAAGVAPLFSATGAISIPLAGTGVLLGASGIFLLMGGALGELIYSTGDLDMSRLPLVTAAARSSSATLSHSPIPATEKPEPSNSRILTP
jgi:glycosyltransferase involved in cell wall biosynthesis